jgi:hypothetical protein
MQNLSTSVSTSSTTDIEALLKEMVRDRLRQLAGDV